MRFKENLLKKIHITKLSKRIIHSVTPPAPAEKFDKESMRRLLEIGDYSLKNKRDLDLYILKDDGDKKKILVLDNGLSIYHTTLNDVALRKSPSVKEMISIKNAIKILNDKDVLISKREDSVKAVKKDLIGMLDLNFSESDIEEIEKEAIASFEGHYVDGVVESLDLFAELLGYKPAPKAFQLPHSKILGIINKSPQGARTFGPLFIYNKIHNTIKLIDDQIVVSNREKIDLFHNIVDGKEKPYLEKEPVFQYLKQAVLEI